VFTTFDFHKNLSQKFVWVVSDHPASLTVSFDCISLLTLSLCEISLFQITCHPWLPQTGAVLSSVSKFYAKLMQYVPVPISYPHSISFSVGQQNKKYK